MYFISYEIFYLSVYESVQLCYIWFETDTYFCVNTRNTCIWYIYTYMTYVYMSYTHIYMHAIDGEHLLKR